ncbi:periplasmic heavy metal sensor [Jannaschia marina]|uniref:periplasmic heavy metal sensor n=1 Tax=Jannaschia marina TaxID=2741674 RepID=UPI0015CE47E5|nr:periplasmic heavy metal sensor [Jannaschia marina]
MTRGWIKVALVVSVALNVAVAAAVAGALLSGEPDRRQGSAGRHGGGPPEIATLARGLDRSDRRALFRALRQDPVLAEARPRILAQRAEVAGTLRADPFDPEAFEAALGAQRRLQAELADRGLVVLTGIIADLSAADRATLADRMTALRGPGR